MSEVHDNGEKKGHKYLYFELFYGGQKLRKYFTWYFEVVLY